jgi:hypothetical protein
MQLKDAPGRFRSLSNYRGDLFREVSLAGQNRTECQTGTPDCHPLVRKSSSAPRVFPYLVLALHLYKGQEQMHEPHQIKVLGLKPPLFVCLMVLGGCMLGGAVYLLSAIAAPHYSLYIPQGHWELAMTPRFTSVQLLDYRAGRLFLKSSDGKLHSCHASSNACSPVGYVPEAPLRFCGEPGSLRPFAPGKVISSLRVRNCDSDVYIDTHFVLVENGSIWKWQRWWNQNNVHLRLASWAIFGAVAGAIGSIIVLWRRSPWLGFANA